MKRKSVSVLQHDFCHFPSFQNSVGLWKKSH